MIKLLTFLFIATGGGTISLILGGMPAARYAVLAAAGMIFAVVSGVLAIFVYRETENRLK